MSVATARRHYEPEDLLRMPDGIRYELVDGELVELNMSVLSSYVAGKVYHRVESVASQPGAGWAFPEGTSYQCFVRSPKKVRRADVSFIRRDRYSEGQLNEEGHLSVYPDLAVEVVSPNDLYSKVDTKVEEWLRAGTSLVWVVNPETRTVHVRRRDGTDRTLSENDELTGEDVLPGLRCRVGDLFPAAGQTRS